MVDQVQQRSLILQRTQYFTYVFTHFFRLMLCYPKITYLGQTTLFIWSSFWPRFDARICVWKSCQTNCYGNCFECKKIAHLPHSHFHYLLYHPNICILNVQFLNLGCAQGIQWDHICIWSNILRQNVDDGGLFTFIIHKLIILSHQIKL